MVKELNEMTPQELGELFPVILVEHDPEWFSKFESEKELIVKRLIAGSIIRIEHIGSTSIPGLVSKPVIDILIEISAGTDLNLTISLFQDLGYHFIHKKENPPPHMMFVKGYSLSGFKGQTYHVHLRYPGEWDEIYFRDWLKMYPEAASEYARLKKKLAKKFRNDREGYTEAKSEFVKKINKIARR